MESVVVRLVERLNNAIDAILRHLKTSMSDVDKCGKGGM